MILLPYTKSGGEVLDQKIIRQESKFNHIDIEIKDLKKEIETLKKNTDRTEVENEMLLGSVKLLISKNKYKNDKLKADRKKSSKQKFDDK
jgi:hypothetical protein